MTCPFLREVQVKYCQTAAVRTLIPMAQAAAAQEKCSSGAHETCPVYRVQPPAAGELGACPYLRESLMQYCTAAPVTKFIPYTEALLSRCGSDSHRYCELYLGMAHPRCAGEATDDIPMPAELHYSNNHMWLDTGGNGVCHAGIDAFLARVIGKVDAITYVKLAGRQRPSAVLSASGTDFEITFPNAFQVTACNLYLRADPSRITEQPYFGGWLFEGTPEEGLTANLRSGGAARAWMQEELRRLSEYLQQGADVVADGGIVVPNLAARLDRGRMIALFHEFFSPYAGEKRES